MTKNADGSKQVKLVDKNYGGLKTGQTGRQKYDESFKTA